MPFGRPVVPELVSSTAGRSVAPSLGRAVVDHNRSGPSSPTCHADSSLRVLSGSSVATTSTRSLASIADSSVRASRGSIGAAVKPADTQPRYAAVNSSGPPITRPTRLCGGISPLRTSRRQRSACAATAAQVSARPLVPSRYATVSGRSSARVNSNRDNGDFSDFGRKRLFRNTAPSLLSVHGNVLAAL